MHLIFKRWCLPDVWQEEAADKRLQKEVQVTLYRNYRLGDFPDIQITYSSLITPLQALAQVVTFDGTNIV